MSYNSLLEDFEANLSLSLNIRQLNDNLVPLIQETAIVDKAVQLHSYLPGGLPFLSGTLSDFFKVPAFSQSQRIFCDLITRRIPDALLSREFAEVGDASTDDQKLLLSPGRPCEWRWLFTHRLSAGLSRPWRDQRRSIRESAGDIQQEKFCRIVDGQPVLGCNIVAVTATLYSFYSSLLPSTLPRGAIFEYVLQTSPLLLHRMLLTDQERIVLPIQKVTVSTISQDQLHRYFRETNQPKNVIVWKVDIDQAVGFGRLKQKPVKNLLSIKNTFNLLAFFHSLSQEHHIVPV
jgi:hypothetical protein